MEARRKGTDEQERHSTPARPAPGGRGAQLRLLNGDDMPAEWHLDPATRERGLVGVQRARQALASTHPPEQRLPRAS